MIVLDASVAIEWLPQTHLGRKAEERISRAASLHAPHLIDIEVAQVLRRYVAGRLVSSRRAEEAVEDLRDLALTRYPHRVLLRRVWDLRQNLTAYDAAYVALAEALDAPLVTCDAKIGSAPGHDARVEVL